jgi:hypothetical protein
MAIAFGNPTEDTILEIIQEAAEDLKQSAPSTLNSTSRDVRGWITAANSAGRAIRRRFLWPALNRRYSITTESGVLSYDIPIDFDAQVFDTFWQQSAYRQMLGPLSPSEWEAQKSGNLTSIVPLQFRMGRSGAGLRQVELLSDPGAGEIFYFQFQTANWLLPTLSWDDGVSVAAGEYAEYGGDVYRANASGTTGATPVVSGSSMNDGGVIWTRARYEKVVENGARPLLDHDLLILGIQIAWAEKNGFECEDKRDLFSTGMNKQIGALAGARTFTLARQESSQFVNSTALPQTGYTA